MDTYSTTTIFAAATWLALHRLAINRGFLMRRKGISTDLSFSCIIGCSVSLWTASVFLSMRETSGDGSSIINQFGTAASAPLLLQLLFGFWVLLYLDSLLAESRGYDKFLMWDLSVTSNCFDWQQNLRPLAFWACFGILTIVITLTSLCAILRGHAWQGILNIIGLSIFLASGNISNPYTKANHRYTADMLRIILPTSHHEGTVYVLPSAEYGFDAVWSPKIENENIEADQQAMALFQNLRSETASLKEPLERIRHIVSSYQERVALTTSELEVLARWIYLDNSSDTVITMRKIRCSRAKNIHLIGRDLMYALCHAEYLVFMSQGRLSPDLQRMIGSLRLMKRSGASISPDSPPFGCIGFKQGMIGYLEAVNYVYKIFDEPVDQNAIHFEVPPPGFSKALSKSPSTIEEYVSDLWDISCQHSESTFTALYMFTLLWTMEMGNCNGFHLFPLRCQNRNGDRVSQQIVWRQAWFSGVACQLLSSSPLFFAAFVAGYLG